MKLIEWSGDLRKLEVFADGSAQVGIAESVLYVVGHPGGTRNFCHWKVAGRVPVKSGWLMNFRESASALMKPARSIELGETIAPIQPKIHWHDWGLLPS